MLLMFLGVVANVQGAELSSVSSPVYEKGIEKEIRISIPNPAVAFEGYILPVNFSTTTIKSEYPTKELAINNEGHFVIYGINQDLLTGDNLVIKGIVNNHGIAKIRIANCLGADKDAEAVVISNFEKTLYSDCDINADGKFDITDIVSLSIKIFTGGANIIDLQKLVNKLIQ